MDRRNNITFILILVLIAAVIWIDVTPSVQIGSFTRSLETRLGLDLKGGLQVLMEVDKPADYVVDPQALQDAKQILENRSNGLGVSEVVFQIAGNRRIVGEFPGLTNTEDVIAVLKQTGELEFIDMGATPLPEGTIVRTDSGSTLPATDTAPATVPTTDPAAPTEPVAPLPEDTVYHTIMTGADLKQVGVGRDTVNGEYYISFDLSDSGRKVFADYTTQNVGKYLAISLDKKLISVPVIKTAITEGSGSISGSFTDETANNLAIQLRYGSLPIPLKVVESRAVGPTLGQDSVNRSIVAGAIGLGIVMLFMAFYYRLPGILADLALITYALITYALFRLIPVTLTLPGIAGFVLSIGMAVDANILIFERLKEELLAGRTLKQAVDLGWKRAWPSIRDSNISTLITCVILFWFGSAFGASLVKGFSLTLAVGVLVSMFTAIIVTRTFLHITLDRINFTGHHKWFGL